MGIDCMNDDLVGLPDLTPREKMGMTAVKVLFRTAILSFIFLGALICYYGLTCPAIAQVESGHICPFFDKIFGRYVYVTRAEQEVWPILVYVGVGCVFACVLIDLDLKRQTRSTTEKDSA